MSTAAHCADEAGALIDLDRWRTGGRSERDRVAEELDAAFRDCGFCLVGGHGVPTELLGELRTLAREFFALPEPVKEQYKAEAGGSGWSAALPIAPGSPPDLKETFSFRAGGSTGSTALDGRRAHRWPPDLPRLAALAGQYLEAMRELSDELLTICAHALGASATHFAEHRRAPTHAGALKWYPSLRHLGTVAADRQRVGSHTDLGALTLIDRQRGLGGLQLQTADGRWVDAPWVPGTLAVNVGELLGRWTGDRWPACRHRVVRPPSTAPEEELVSLLYVSGADHDALIEAFPPPVGNTFYPPVRWGDYLRANLTAQR